MNAVNRLNGHASTFLGFGMRGIWVMSKAVIVTYPFLEKRVIGLFITCVTIEIIVLR